LKQFPFIPYWFSQRNRPRGLIGGDQVFSHFGITNQKARQILPGFLVLYTRVKSVVIIDQFMRFTRKKKTPAPQKGRAGGQRDKVLMTTVI
jgi:hypothetical protein